MSQQTETPLLRSLQVIDRIRRRVLAGGWLAVIVTLGAYARFYQIERTTHSPEELVSAALIALTCLIAWTAFATILVVVRMTGKILRAIDLKSQ